MEGPVLIVDDNPDNLLLTSILLESEGFEVATAEDGERALGLLESLRPRMILMDVQMPIMDGLEVTRRLRMNPEFETVTIIALTAYAMTGDQEKALAAGCDGYITKPVDTRTFSKQVREYLERGPRDAARLPEYSASRE